MREAQGNLKENLKENIRENIQENIKEFEEKKTSMRYAKVMAGGMCSLLGTILAIYVGGWLMIFAPVKETLAAFVMGTLTKRMVLISALKCALSLTTAGAIWCCGYILNRKIIGYEEC